MPSSISSSNQRLPRLAWPLLLGVALAVLIAWIGTMEIGLARRGFKAGMLDTETLWLEKRARADTVGKQGLILVGDSRTQLDLDQQVLRQRTGLEPVQLAIDGSSFLPVLRGIAADPLVSGTVLVGFAPAALADSGAFAESSGYERDAERSSGRWRLPDFTMVDRRLADAWHGHLRSYADGGSPLNALTKRLLSSAATPQYLTTLPDRSTLADYSRVAMPDLYYKRVFRNLGESPDAVSRASNAENEAKIRSKIAALRPLDDTFFRRHIADIAAMAAAIKARGGRVIFVIYPESGYVRQIDDRRYPRAQFWDLFAAEAGTQTFDYTDDPALKGIVCPDGSHLDFRQRAAFTSELLDALKLGKQSATSKP